MRVCDDLHHRPYSTPQHTPPPPPHSTPHQYRDVAMRMVLLISEVEELSQQLNEQYEEDVRGINAEALHEINELRQQNEQLGEEVGRLRGQLSAAAANTSDTARLDQLQEELTHMAAENTQVGGGGG